MLNKKEMAIAHIASAITVYSIRQNTNTLPKNVSMIDFILKTVPDDIKPDITMDLIDYVFSYVSATRFDTQFHMCIIHMIYCDIYSNTGFTLCTSATKRCKR